MKKVGFIVVIFFAFLIRVKAISSSSYIVMDMETNRFLMGSNINDKRLVASTSKIMTCIIALENGDLNQKVKVTKDILKAPGSSIYLEIGEEILLKDLIYGMMMRSGNDAATMIAITISGSMDDFTKMMNDYASKIGMIDSYFYNSHGLENEDGNGNTSTAYDMALLTSYAMKNKTFKKIFKTQNYTAKSDKKSYTWNNKNKLLKYDYITGGKTGYTKKAHRTLVTTANINRMNIVIVTLNDGNDWNDHLNLYKKVKETYQKVKILDKDNFSIVDDNLYFEDQLYIKKSLYLTLSKKEISELQIKYYLNDIKIIKNNEKVGNAKIFLNNNAITSLPIYITKHTNNRSFMQKVFD